MTGAKVIEAVQEGRADAGVLNFVQYRKKRYPTIPSDVQLVPLYRDHLALMVSDSSRYAKCKSVSFKTKLEEPLIVTSQGEGKESPMLSFVRSIGITAPSIIETESWEIASQMVVDGIGVALSSFTSIIPDTCRMVPYENRVTTNVSFILPANHPNDTALKLLVNESLRIIAHGKNDGRSQLSD